MDFLRPVIRPYPWGTRTAIAELQGRPVPAPGPEAELWMGAHPSAPSGVGWTTLDEAIAVAPAGRGGLRRRERARPGGGRPGQELRGRLAQTRAPLCPDPVRGGGRPA